MQIFYLLLSFIQSFKISANDQKAITGCQLESGPGIDIITGLNTSFYCNDRGSCNFKGVCECDNCYVGLDCKFMTLGTEFKNAQNNLGSYLCDLSQAFFDIDQKLLAQYKDIDKFNIFIEQLAKLNDLDFELSICNKQYITQILDIIKNAVIKSKNVFSTQVNITQIVAIETMITTIFKHIYTLKLYEDEITIYEQKSLMNDYFELVEILNQAYVSNILNSDCAKDKDSCLIKNSDQKRKEIVKTKLYHGYIVNNFLNVLTPQSIDIYVYELNMDEFGDTIYVPGLETLTSQVGISIGYFEQLKDHPYLIQKIYNDTANPMSWLQFCQNTNSTSYANVYKYSGVDINGIKSYEAMELEQGNNYNIRYSLMADEDMLIEQSCLIYDQHDGSLNIGFLVDQSLVTATSKMTCQSFTFSYNGIKQYSKLIAIFIYTLIIYALI